MNDARAIANTLRQSGFEVLEGFDADKKTLKGFASNFADKAKTADVALFFFAGHAVQVRGQNFLLPVDAEVRSADDLRTESLLWIVSQVKCLGMASLVLS